jgi:hypothetical protein
MRAMRTTAGTGNDAYIYIVLTDTGTTFSKLSKVITRDTYNHVSIAFDRDMSLIYTYALTTEYSKSGGFKVEDLSILAGAKYALYALRVSIEVRDALRARIISTLDKVTKTSYNHLALLNTIFRKELFKSKDSDRMICSEFVLEILKTADIELLEGQISSLVRPGDIAKSDKLELLEEGVIANLSIRKPDSLKVRSLKRNLIRG